MQTISRFGRPRNGPTYSHSFAPTLDRRDPYWDAFNRTEYHTWRASRGFIAGPLFFNIEAEAERKAHIAKARFFLGLAASIRVARATGGARC